MKRSRYYNFALLMMALCASFTFVIHANESPSPDAADQITQRLKQWPEDFNSKKIPEICGLFSEKLIASYPETKDITYVQMCEKLSKIVDNPLQTFHYDEPQIEQIIIDRDIAVVRLIWTLTIRNLKDSTSEVIKEKGLDVFSRQPNGDWKIIISYAYPLN